MSMPLTGVWEPGNADWATKQVRAFEASDGQEANTLRGVPIVVVTMAAKTPGVLRKIPVMRVEHDGEYAVVASKGGAPAHPGWYHNLVRSPHVELQDGGVRRDYVARLVDGAERDAWWARAVAVWPDYAGYQAKTDRVIPVFVVSRIEATAS